MRCKKKKWGENGTEVDRVSPERNSEDPVSFAAGYAKKMKSGWVSILRLFSF